MSIAQGPSFHRPTFAEINLDALELNLQAVRELCPKTRLLAVVKANAYGHGAVPVARALEERGVDFFGVALVEEGIELREAGIRSDILVLGGAYLDYDAVLEQDLTPVVYTAEHLARLNAAAARAGIEVKAHLKVDTGMGRIGVLNDELPAFLAAAEKAPHVVLDGLASHFANADLADRETSQKQLARFRAALALVRAAGHPVTFRHISNSAGVMHLDEVKDGFEMNLVRPGLMLYGEYPAKRLEPSCTLEPILTWKTAIVHLKRVPAGTPVSYGGTWVAARESLIATLPVGYADGYNRKLSNAGEVLVRGRRVKIAGNVCMDMCMADVTDVPGVSAGDEVVLLGPQGEERVTAESIAAKVGTIHYEVLCDVGARVPRLVVKKR